MIVASYKHYILLILKHRLKYVVTFHILIIIYKNPFLFNSNWKTNMFYYILYDVFKVSLFKISILITSICFLYLYKIFIKHSNLGPSLKLFQVPRTLASSCTACNLQSHYWLVDSITYYEQLAAQIGFVPVVFNLLIAPHEWVQKNS